MTMTSHYLDGENGEFGGDQGKYHVLPVHQRRITSVLRRIRYVMSTSRICLESITYKAKSNYCHFLDGVLRAYGRFIAIRVRGAYSKNGVKKKINFFSRRLRWKMQKTCKNAETPKMQEKIKNLAREGKIKTVQEYRSGIWLFSRKRVCAHIGESLDDGRYLTGSYIATWGSVESCYLFHTNTRLQIMQHKLQQIRYKELRTKNISEFVKKIDRAKIVTVKKRYSAKIVTAFCKEVLQIVKKLYAGAKLKWAKKGYAPIYRSFFWNFFSGFFAWHLFLLTFFSGFFARHLRRIFCNIFSPRFLTRQFRRLDFIKIRDKCGISCPVTLSRFEGVYL